MRAESHAFYFANSLVIDICLNEALVEDIALEQELMVGFESVQ